MTRHVAQRVDRYLTAVETAALRAQDPHELPAHVARWRCVRIPPVVEPWICQSAQCAGDWTDRGSYALGRCTRCGTPRPE